MKIKVFNFNTNNYEYEDAYIVLSNILNDYADSYSDEVDDERMINETYDLVEQLLEIYKEKK